ncbi:13025_t:CDS:1, partial [Dentiscutata erythropus]
NDYRPVGHKAMRIILPDGPQDPKDPQNLIINTLKDCVAEASLLDRFASFVSAYYIFVGIFIGIAGATQCIEDKQDWPYIPLLFIWNLPVIYFRIKYGLVVIKEPIFNGRLFVESYKECELSDKQKYVLFVALISILLPWPTVVIAYFTRPVGFFCRSKFLTIICSIWSFNNIVAYIRHINGEGDVHESGIIDTIFWLSGVIILIGLGFLSVLAADLDLWVSIFGSSCYVPSSC